MLHECGGILGIACNIEARSPWNATKSVAGKVTPQVKILCRTSRTKSRATECQAADRKSIKVINKPVSSLKKNCEFVETLQTW